MISQTLFLLKRYGNSTIFTRDIYSANNAFFLSYIHVPSSIGRVVVFRIKKRKKKRKESKSHDFYFPLINRKDFVIICMYTLYTTCVEKKKKRKKVQETTLTRFVFGSTITFRPSSHRLSTCTNDTNKLDDTLYRYSVRYDR